MGTISLTNLTLTQAKYLNINDEMFQTVLGRFKKNPNPTSSLAAATATLNGIVNTPNLYNNEKKALLNILGTNIILYAKRTRSCWAKILAIFGYKRVIEKQLTALAINVFSTAAKPSVFDFGTSDIRALLSQDPRISHLFTVATNNQAPQLRQYLDSLQKSELQGLISRINLNYRHFLQWMEASGRYLSTLQPSDRQIAHIQRSQFADEVYSRYSTIVRAVADQYPELFRTTILPLKGKDPRYPTCVIMPEGTRSLVRACRELSNVTVCDTYQDYASQLSKIAAHPASQFHFS